MKNQEFDAKAFIAALKEKEDKAAEKEMAHRFFQCESFNSYFNLLADCRRMGYDKAHPIVVACVYALYEKARCEGLADNTVEVRRLLNNSDNGEAAITQIVDDRYWG